MGMNIPLLAAFISPALFVGGAAAIGAPILIHLLARRRFRRIRWAAMEFLIDAERRNRRRIHMEEWILLALRCLAVLCIALLIARPFINPSGAAALLGGSVQTERIFVLDDSASTAYQAADRTVFERAQLAVHRILEAVRRESPDDTVTILRMSDPETPIESGTYLDEVQTEELLARLDALTPTRQSIDVSQVMDNVGKLLNQGTDITNAAIYFISDFQRHDWVWRTSTSGETVTSKALTDPLANWANDDRSLRVILIDVGDDDASNTALTGLSLKGGRIVAGANGSIRTEVANFSSRRHERLELEAYVGNLTQPTQTIPELAPGETTTVDMEMEFIRAGSQGVRVEIPEDALPVDDVRYLAVDVAGAIRVLIVDGEPSTDSYDDEVGLLSTALRPDGDLFSGNEIEIVDEAQFDVTSLSEFHVVVLANVYRLSEPGIESLERFVGRGGGLLIFLGDQVDPDLYNIALYRDGTGLLPARLTESIRVPEASHLMIADRLHPALRGLGIEGDPLGISEIPFFEYFASVLPAFENTDQPSGEQESDTPSPTVGPARVIARFDDAQERPAIIERLFGQGRVILVTTSADKEWHQWPDHPTYLPIMTELVRHVARSSESGSAHWTGEPIELPIDPALFETDAQVRTPGYPAEREIDIAAVPTSDGKGLSLRWEQTPQPGLYQFLLRRRDGGETLRLVAVNLDPAESDLTPAQEGELRAAMGDIPTEYIEGIANLSDSTGEGRTELWRLCLVAAVIVLMTEQSLAWWWGRRR